MNSTRKRMLVAFLSISTVWGLSGMDPLRPQTSSEIKHISTSEKDKSRLDSKGRMDVPFLSNLLKQAYEQKKLLYEPFKNPKGLRIKKLTEAEKEAPWGATQIFLLDTPQQSFILKGMAEPKEEIENLIKSVQTAGLRKYIYPHDNYEYPQFLFPSAYLSYSDQKGKKQFLSLMPTAPGKSLSDLLKKFADKPGDPNNIRAIAQAYYDFGATIARFYKKTDRKITHGDLHHGNIFYDTQNRRITLITLIDNERIAKSSRRPDLCAENAFLLLKSLFVVKWTNPKLLSKLNREEWYPLYLTSYITGYLSVFSQKERQNIYKWLVNCLKKYVNPEDGNQWYLDKGILGFRHKDYMDRIFEKLKTSKVLFKMDRATINTRDEHGKTLLHYAALDGEWRLIWPLIVSGAETEIMDNEFNTPLHEASYNDHVEVIKALVKAGADINAQDARGFTPLDKAQANNSKNAIETLKYYGARSGKQ